MIVIDASSMMALTGAEPGAERVRSVVHEAVMSTANVAEILSKAVDRGLDPELELATIHDLLLDVVPVSVEDAQRSASIRAVDAADGRPSLSLADRLCLALALRLDVPVLTGDRAWADIDLGVEVELIR